MGHWGKVRVWARFGEWARVEEAFLHIGDYWCVRESQMATKKAFSRAMDGPVDRFLEGGGQRRRGRSEGVPRGETASYIWLPIFKYEEM